MFNFKFLKNNKMKNFKYIILAVIGLTFFSCDDEFLNPLPDSAIVIDAFFNDDDDVVAGLVGVYDAIQGVNCLLYTSPSPRDATLSRMPSSA